MHDPVIADLNRHLNAQDREDSRSEEADSIISEWMKDHKQVEDTLVNSEMLEEEDFLTIVAAAVVSGDWHRVSGYVEDGLRQQWEEAAAQEADRRVEQSWADAAEAQENSREGYDGR